MEQLKARQIAQMQFAINDYREERITLGAMLSRLEGASKTFSTKFWEEEIFPYYLELEQFNADFIEERRKPSPAEAATIERVLVSVESSLQK